MVGPQLHAGNILLKLLPFFVGSGILSCVPKKLPRSQKMQVVGASSVQEGQIGADGE